MKTTPNRAKAGKVNGTPVTVVRNADVQGPDVDVFKHNYLDRPLDYPWLIRSVNSFGQEEWFVRVEVAGLHPRRFGPIATKEEAKEFYAQVLDDLDSLLDIDLPNKIQFGMFIEDELGSAYLLPKGG